MLDKAARQRRLADMLRKQAMGSQFEADPGRMVSGHYVAPSWAQGLNNAIRPVMDNRAAAQAEALAAQQEAASSGAVNVARQQWQSSLPQALAGVAERAGPIDPNNLGELSEVPAQPVTTGRVLNHTLAGLAIPGNEKAAGVYNQGALADIAREDQQNFRKEEAAAARAASIQKGIADREAKVEELRIRMGDKALDRASREQIAQAQRQLTQQIANGNLELRRLAIEARQDAERARREDKAATAKEKQVTTTEGEKSAAGYYTRMIESEKLMEDHGEKSRMGLFQKAVGGLPMVGRTLQPYTMNADEEKLYQAQQDWVRAKLRKESGAVIGDEEMAEEIRTYFPMPGESKEVAEQKKQARQVALRQMEIGSGREAKNATMTPDALPVGTVQGGYKYLGGDPAKPSSWSKQ